MAGKRFFSGVGEHVVSERRCFSKPPPTGAAGVRLLPCVGSLVGTQMAVLTEAFPTGFT